MVDDSDDLARLLLESNQQEDSIADCSLGQEVRAQLLSFRSSEATSQGLPCQDYARARCNHDGSTVCFCVCDGVGSSYKGGFAAQYLATSLVDWLYGLKSIPRWPYQLVKVLQPRLDEWARDAQAELSCFTLPEDMPALVREVLEELRDTYGSETVFLCGRIESGSNATPSLLVRPVRVLFIWMGNVSARLFSKGQLAIEIGENENDYNRWSTARGRHGVVKMKVFTLHTLDRLMVHTDGLNSIAGELAVLSSADLQERVQQLLTLSVNDDMTMLDFKWLREVSEKVGNT